jgi:hypothetical protein
MVPLSAEPSICGGVGSWSSTPDTAGVLVEGGEQRGDLLLGRVGRQPVVEPLDADLGDGPLLAADVDGAGRIVTDEDRRQTGRRVAGPDPRGDSIASSARTCAAIAFPSMSPAATRPTPYERLRIGA